MTLGKILKGYREKSGLTLVVVAEKIGVDKQTIWRWENNKRIPSIIQIGLLSDLYHVPANERGVFLNPPQPSTPNEEAVTEGERANEVGKAVA